MKEVTLKSYRPPSSGNERFIATLAIGKEYLDRWEALSLPFWRIFCERHDLGLVAMIHPYADPQARRPDWQKFLVGRAMRDFGHESGRVCFVDYDIIPNPFAPDVFAAMNRGMVGFVSEIFGLPYGESSELLRRMAFHRNRASSGAYPLDSYLTAPVKRLYADAGLPVLADYGCGGLFLFDIVEHGGVLERAFTSKVDPAQLIANVGEEVHLNYVIQSGFDVQWLPYEWHTLWCYEVAAYYPWLYEKNQRSEANVEQAILSTLMRSNFLHFVGSWEKWAWKAVPALLKDSALSQLERFQEFRYAELASPSLGQIFPHGDDQAMLTK